MGLLEFESPFRSLSPTIPTAPINMTVTGEGRTPQSVAFSSRGELFSFEMLVHVPAVHGFLELTSHCCRGAALGECALICFSSLTHIEVELESRSVI